MKSIEQLIKGSNWVHHITNEFVTVLGVEGHMVDYQDNCGQKGRQGVEWFLSSYKPLPVDDVICPKCGGQYCTYINRKYIKNNEYCYPCSKNIDK